MKLVLAMCVQVAIWGAINFGIVCAFGFTHAHESMATILFVLGVVWGWATTTFAIKNWGDA